MQHENNELISRIDEVNNFFIERRTVDIAICKFKEGIYHSNMPSNHIKKTGTVFGEFLCKMFNSFLMHNNIPKKRVFTEISLRMNDNTVCKTKLENYRPVMNSPLQLKVFEYMLLPLLTNNLKSCNQ